MPQHDISMLSMFSIEQMYSPVAGDAASGGAAEPTREQPSIDLASEQHRLKVKQPNPDDAREFDPVYKSIVKLSANLGELKDYTVAYGKDHFQQKLRHLEVLSSDAQLYRLNGLDDYITRCRQTSLGSENPQLLVAQETKELWRTHSGTPATSKRLVAVKQMAIDEATRVIEQLRGLCTRVEIGKVTDLLQNQKPIPPMLLKNQDAQMIAESLSENSAHVRHLTQGIDARAKHDDETILRVVREALLYPTSLLRIASVHKTTNRASIDTLASIIAIREQWKTFIENFYKEIPPGVIGEPIMKCIHRINNIVKSLPRQEFHSPAIIEPPIPEETLSPFEAAAAESPRKFYAGKQKWGETVQWQATSPKIRTIHYIGKFADALLLNAQRTLTKFKTTLEPIYSALADEIRRNTVAAAVPTFASISGVANYGSPAPNAQPLGTHNAQLLCNLFDNFINWHETIMQYSAQTPLLENMFFFFYLRPFIVSVKSPHTDKVLSYTVSSEAIKARLEPTKKQAEALLARASIALTSRCFLDATSFTHYCTEKLMHLSDERLTSLIKKNLLELSKTVQDFAIAWEKISSILHKALADYINLTEYEQKFFRE